MFSLSLPYVDSFSHPLYTHAWVRTSSYSTYIIHMSYAYVMYRVYVCMLYCHQSYIYFTD